MCADLRQLAARIWLAAALLGMITSGARGAEQGAPQNPGAAAADEDAPQPQPIADAPAAAERAGQEPSPAEPPAAEPAADEASASPDQSAPSQTNAAKPSEELALDVLGIRGVQLGQTTREAVHAKLGEPMKVERIAGGVRETYSLKSPGHARLTYVDDVVQSVATRLELPLEVETVAKQLQLDTIEPVDVIDEQGQVLGRAYPERGVLLGFAPQSNPPAVFQIVMEAVDSQPFLDRAEKRLTSRYADCLADIQSALALMPDNGRAHWLHAELALRAGALEDSLRAAQRSVELEPKEPEYRLTLAKILAASGDMPPAIEQVKGVIDWGKAPPVVAARAYCLWGDFVSASQEHDYAQAIQHHMQAIKLAEPLAADPKQGSRRAAKELLVDANLGVAHDIGWGRWQHKKRVVPKWIERASAHADEIVAAEPAATEMLLRVHQKALSALAGVSDPPEIGKWLTSAKELGQKAIEASDDPAYKAHVAWQLAIALNDAVEVQAALGQWEEAVAAGQAALEYFAQGEPAGKNLPAHDYLRGRLCYRMGAIYAVQKTDHGQAVSWFEKAVPLLESPVPAAVIDVGKQGEIFVSMAVSYWDLKNRDEALRLTNQGVKLMEQAISDGLLPKTALAIPYGNLASMYEQLGDAQAAKKYSELASRHEGTTSK